MELNILEINVLKAIDMSSCFEIEVIIKVYEECKSFDKTISVLKLAIKHHISPIEAIDWLGYHK